MTETSLPVGDSKAIVSNQDGIHENLADIVKKHLAHPSQKPYQQHTLQAFEEANARVAAHNGPVILDSCCGVGQSTRLIAQQHPDALVIGVDKSAHRINRNVDEVCKDSGEVVDNYLLIRADLNDFYRLVVKQQWQVAKHYILYPNPWPKSKHIRRRWHGSAVFPEIMQIGQSIILRSNWRLYLEEFQFAADLTGLTGQMSQVDDATPLTPFEAKYRASGQTCWQLSFQR